MRVALIGASGAAGSRILRELVRRGHTVLALARHPEKVEQLTGVEARAADTNDPVGLTRLLKGVDAVVSSVKFKDFDGTTLINAVRAADVKRYIVVGGAGSLEISPGLLEMNSPKFPAHVKPEAEKGAHYLDQLRASDLDWTFLSPSRFFNPGERTGKFRLGTDQLLTDATGKSAISLEDYAIALVDELEQSRHVRARFTVGY
ncbi:MAG: NAD(P)-dependent oxidoreductase [Steroidobacteraceae bacterium]|jgi:putative NADH-flavin reductase